MITLIRGMQGDVRFAGFLAWVESELKERDTANRYIGQENKSSEAECLSDILKIVAACWAPRTDRDLNVPGAE